jgi:hypothetical protein
METNQIYHKCIESPAHSGAWTIEKIEFYLSRNIPQSLLATKPVRDSKTGKTTHLWYVPWHQANKILSKYCPGWQWEIVSTQVAGERLILVGKLSIPTSTGWVSRSATGTEKLDCSSFGDPSSNAESMAFRRSAARFGLGLYLYQEK